MTRLTALLQDSQQKQEKLLSVFITAGFPHLESTVDLVLALESAGADCIELGMPFSDPIADGPTIQQSSQIALQNGMTLSKWLEQVHEIRKVSEIPMVFMGYLNPILKFGLRSFIQQAADAGADGFIIPDLPPEEWLTLADELNGIHTGLNFLISPNTPDLRIQQVDRLTCDFIYCVSVTGITGARQGVPFRLIQFLQRVKRLVTHPFMVGFGISNPEDARQIAKHCHGVIVGSAVIKLLLETPDLVKGQKLVEHFVKNIKIALKGV